MASITKMRRPPPHMNTVTNGDPLVPNDLEIGPIKVEQDASTDYESNEEPGSPAINTETTKQLEPKNEKLKKRGKNFSPEEELTLVELVEERNDVLNNKKSDAFTWKHKEEVWAELTANFIAKTGVRREWRQLRDKYLHMKRRAKVELAKERAHSLCTGAEPVAPIVSTVSEKIVAMIGDSALCLKKSMETEGNQQIENEQSLEGEEMMLYNFVAGDRDATASASEDDLTSTSSKRATCKMGTLRCPILKNSLPEKSAGRLSNRLEEEKLKLLRLQQNFCRCENERAQEKHDMEMLERRSKLEGEVEERKLRFELLELEIKYKKAKLDIKCEQN